MAALEALLRDLLPVANDRWGGTTRSGLRVEHSLALGRSTYLQVTTQSYLPSYFRTEYHHTTMLYHASLQGCSPISLEWIDPVASCSRADLRDVAQAPLELLARRRVAEAAGLRGRGGDLKDK